MSEARSFEPTPRSEGEVDSPSRPLIEVRGLAHPTQQPRFVLAVIVCFPVALLAVVASALTFGLVPLYIGMVVLSVWLVARILQTQLRGNMLRVSLDNFPEILVVVDEAKRRMQYEKPVEVFVTEEGSINAMLVKLLGVRAIVLNSGLVEAMDDPHTMRQLEFIVGRFVGGLKARHMFLAPLAMVIDAVESLQVFNLLLFSFDRSTVYSGDQMGLVFCEDLGAAMDAMNKLSVGNGLHERVGLDGVFEQSDEVRGGLLSLLARLYSRHPHMMSRYTNLLGFASRRQPELFSAYLEKLPRDLQDSVRVAAGQAQHWPREL